MEKKVRLRKETIAHLLAFSKTKRQNIEKVLYQQFIETDLYKNSEIIGVTVSHAHEWDTRNIIKRAISDGKRVCVPLCLTETKTLDFYYLTSFDQLSVGHFHLLEPNPAVMNKTELSAIDLLIVPGVVFDNAHYRIGHGGGYYDRLLEKFSGRTLSLLHESQYIDRIPVEIHDQPVERLIIARN
ncbi:5-formyltetrahydrofolate cyclo-ligase [Halolactibacillus halophilus]|uniref:5-formyltetrahydrofolate cyclo-ligase n=1 Tax=Halolactibacillus halophilus TaxID=306540 RepID=A0A1I5KSC7_9BACI|nr:5-formyltetrahydrofolate cyclo-ligase [Halolactibacillus halophilus]GEM00483.1 5-formyltetrahydrofolate cyclo-ligase [Halolactibacillus halophilus]SFO87852.1 5-formyltetrahydrofolate cyclo-ligase [Halolactibacillus halophilus]